MWVALTNRNARVTRATPEERDWLRGYLSFPDPDAKWRGRTPEEAIRRLYEEVSATFPSGFVPAVVKAGAAEGHRVELVDLREVPAERDPSADTRWLRPYQLAAVERCVERGRGVLAHSTGSGKSEVMVALTRVLPCRWLVMAPNLALANNVADRFLLRNREHGVDLGEPGRVGEGRWSEGDRLTCATYQSVQRAVGTARGDALLAGVGGLIAEECHGVPAVTFLEATRACDAYWRFGFSATPLARGDMKGALALGALGPVIHKVTAAELVASGDVSRARVRFSTVKHPMPDGFTYGEVYDELVVNSRARNAVLVEMARGAEKPAFLFVNRIEHGRALLTMLRAAGVRAEFAWGDHGAEQLGRYVAALVRGDLDVLVTSAVLKQGHDVPSLRTVVMGAGGKSVIDALQKLGRGSRVERDAAGRVVKDEFALLDVYDADGSWLEEHSKARRRAYAQEGYEVVVVPEGPRAFAARRTA